MPALSTSGAAMYRAPPSRQKVDPSNVLLGSALQLFEVSTLGQPFENIKTMQAAHRSDSLLTSLRRIYAHNGARSFWQGLIPWAWLEAATKGGVLLFAQTELSNAVSKAGMSPLWASAIGGMGGGVCQAYTTMGICTFMKTVEVTRDKASGESSMQVAARILRNDGISGLYRGVNAVALRQATNWGSRFGISKAVEKLVRRGREGTEITRGERLGCSVVGGGLACWNQPIEVVRVEMQRRGGGAGEGVSMGGAVREIFAKDGLRGFYRGVLPRVGLSVYLTSVMVFGGDEAKRWLADRKRKNGVNKS